MSAEEGEAMKMAAADMKKALRTPAGQKAFFEQADEELGLDQLKLK